MTIVALAPRAELVDGVGRQLLAGAAFARQQDGDVERRDLDDLLLEALHGEAVARHVVQTVAAIAQVGELATIVGHLRT